MSTTPTEPSEVQPTSTTPEPSTAVTTPEPAPAPAPTEPPKSDPWDDPAAAKAEIERLRKENAKDRTNAKAQAAADARKEIGKLLGLVEDDAADPAKLTESLTQAQRDAQKARVELAVFRNAASAGGDPAKLLKHVDVLTTLESIDPADTAAIEAAIKSAVEANPWLGAAPAEPKAPAPNPAQGASASGPAGAAQLTEDEVKRLYAERKYGEIEKAKQDGRLNAYLGIQ